jgi:hypothetical protein
MHLSREEGVFILDMWWKTKTSLTVFFSRPGADRLLQATISELTGSAVKLVSDSDELHVELEGAEFNGDQNASASSDYAAYLVCKFRNCGRCYFYVPLEEKKGGDLFEASSKLD